MSFAVKNSKGSSKISTEHQKYSKILKHIAKITKITKLIDIR
jgi:hypothetical protein